VHQLRLSLIALLTIPITYGLLELPKTIINSAIDNDNYIIDSSPFGVPQMKYLLILCALYLLLLFFNGALKFVLNWYKGSVSEGLIKRLRLYIFAIQRKKPTNESKINMAPVLLQEVEPICAFSGDSFVVPLLQGGTALTVIVFMMMQSVVLGAAVMTLIPVQLIVVPIFQRKINLLVKKRLLEVRSLNTMITQEDKQYTNKGQKSIRYSFNRLHQLRIQLFKTKYLMKSINNFIMNLTPFFFYTVGGYLVIEGKLSLGALVASLASYKDLSSTIRELFIYYQTLQDTRTRYIEMVKHIF
jgi:ABC-type bacteriocin/lantibiotic exporter with double-glycine peptidase domain